MKKKYFLWTLLLIFPLMPGNAQEWPGRHPEKRERFQALKVAYFTEKLEFSIEEAEKFWPVYNEFEKKRAALHQERRNAFKSFVNRSQTITDKEAQEMIDLHIASEKQELEMEIDFYTRIREILPPKKIMKLYLTEIEFREYMLRQIRGAKGGRPGERRVE